MAWWGWLVLVWLPSSVVTSVWMGRAIHAAEMSEWTRRRRPDRRAERLGSPHDAIGPRLGPSDRGGDGSSLGETS